MKILYQLPQILDKIKNYNNNNKMNSLPQQLQISQLNFKSKQLKYNKKTNSPYSMDIITGVYEGGYKIWECTLDLLKYMDKHAIMNQQNGSMQIDKEQMGEEAMKLDFRGKIVMDVGCGHGLLGIAALICGAQFCYFQDYNADVLQNATQTNLLLNDIPSQKYKLISGDWQSLALPAGSPKMDMLIGAQLIYKEQNYQKLLLLCQKYLNPEGMAVLANKCYYFGVGGSIDDFVELAEKKGYVTRCLERIVPNKGGNKKEITAIWSAADCIGHNIQ